MAVDEALLNCFSPELSQPVLRLYGWCPPALSLGRFQDAAQVLDLQRCRHDSIDIVRRVSGGGTIYHADELTYSIVCTQEQIPSATSVKDSFRVLTGFLIGFYRVLGLDAAYAGDVEPDRSDLGARTDFCFAGRETFDIMLNGRKIGGNAQRRLKNVIFQHGSIPIANRALTGLQYMSDRTPSHAGGITSLEECGVTSCLAELTDLLAQTFCLHMGVEARPDGLTQAETACSHEMLECKYGSAEWNLKGVSK
jgi:lipoate-protein ligase A